MDLLHSHCLILLHCLQKSQSLCRPRSLPCLSCKDMRIVARMRQPRPAKTSSYSRVSKTCNLQHKRLPFPNTSTSTHKLCR